MRVKITKQKLPATQKVRDSAKFGAPRIHDVIISQGRQSLSKILG